MLRFLLALFFLSSYLMACEGGYESCKAKVRDLQAIQNGSLILPLSDGKLLIYSKNIPNASVLKHDPFLSLYLVKAKKTTKYPFTINTHLALGNAAVNEHFAIEGKITQQQIGLEKFARFNEVPFVPSLLLNSCCSLEGIVTSRGIIQKEYLLHFIESKEVAYGDIGVRVDDSKEGIEVLYIDPYLVSNPFLKGDIVVMLDDKKVSTASELMQKVLFSSPNSLHRVQVKRGGILQNFNVTSQQRFGGGFLSDTFLEQKGLQFNEALEVVFIDTNRVKNGLLRGDKLIQINGIRVYNQEDVLRALSEPFKERNFLFQRDFFQFFVQIN